MTVITKAILEKKPADKMEQPLVVDESTENKGDPEAQRPQRDMAGHYLILRRIRPNLGPNSMTLYCLLFTALLGMSIGVIGGVYIYKRYAREQMHRFRTGWYSIPYERMDNKLPLLSDALAAGIPPDTNLFKTFARNTEREALVLEESAEDNIRNFFQESFEIDLENEHEEIDVPDFRGGREGRFIHDFNINLTGIIDLDSHSCFVMPLNRQRVLPPKNMYDLLNKMYNGEYDVNTEVVRETMKATIPPISDRSSVGTYIARECKRMPIYQLEKISNSNNGIVKRSVDGVLFGQFAGYNIVEYDISNMEEVQEKASAK
ncbi:integral membrane protein 2B isoform X1 [Diachasma alloeum]|uniref:integral membrane protein 2B isoform X1 n=2 Tax=Diachasma alloeum TaxID=454923 RepID=UPI0007384FB3|nr:integral membrane protein 2B isoform X1 [Diachasma alloeum]